MSKIAISLAAKALARAAEERKAGKNDGMGFECHSNRQKRQSWKTVRVMGKVQQLRDDYHGFLHLQRLRPRSLKPKGKFIVKHVED